MEGVTPEVNANVNSGLWVMVMMSQHRFISCEPGEVLVGMLIMKEAVWGQEYMGNLCTVHSVFIWT